MKNLALLLLANFLLFTVSGCSQSEQMFAKWESGVETSEEAPETEILEPLNENTMHSLTNGDRGLIAHRIEDFLETMRAPSKPGLYFSINRANVSLAHGPGVTWLGCETKAAVRGGYDSDSTCGRAYFHPRFESQLNSHFYGCIEFAAQKAGIARPAKVFLNHLGSYNDRNGRGSSTLSMHAYARAIDLAQFNLFDAAGKITKVSTHVRNFSGKTKTFYNTFRQCWKEAMPSTCTSSKSEYKGSIGIPSSDLGGNSLHNDHIHLSFALCAR